MGRRSLYVLIVNLFHSQSFSPCVDQSITYLFDPIDVNTSQWSLAFKTLVSSTSKSQWSLCTNECLRSDRSSERSSPLIQTYHAVIWLAIVSYKAWPYQWDSPSRIILFTVSLVMSIVTAVTADNFTLVANPHYVRRHGYIHSYNINRQPSLRPYCVYRTDANSFLAWSIYCGGHRGSDRILRVCVSDVIDWHRIRSNHETPMSGIARE